MPAVHGFEHIRTTRVEEINSEARIYRHAKTGAELVSIVNDDENKCFGITFRTPPDDSTGLPHILEHSVLCGSRKYPVKDPFIRLAQGSLNTFLNAMTYADKTTYPTASQNLQDFYNLVDVYIDAVLHPRITREIFEQEGWHFELESPNRPMIYKGVVFNEMKGAYSSPDTILGDLSQQVIFPDNTYGHNSGGNPAVIPELTYESFKAFHARYYHPSNARIWFYGDDDPTERLRLLDARLSEFDRVEVGSRIAVQPRFTAPRRIEGSYAAGDDPATARTHIALNWMLERGQDAESGLALAMLDQILTGTPASPLHKALIDSGLGEEVVSSVDFNYQQVAAMIGLKGIEATDADKVEQLILDTLSRLATNGIDKATIESAVNTVEFRLRESNTGRFPRGLALMLESLTSWLYERDPLAPIAFAAPLARIKARLAAGERVFEDLIRRELVDNPHRGTVVVRPDATQAAREAEEERARLAAAQARLGPKGLEQMAARTAELKRWQETPDTAEAIAAIPSLKLSDLPRTNKAIPVEIERTQGIEVLRHDIFTNGILYLDLAFDLHALPPDTLPLVRIFSRALLETGAGSQDFVTLSERIGRSTGGINASTHIATRVDRKGSVARLMLRAKAVPDRAAELVSILIDVLTSARLNDRERIQQIALEEKASAEAMLAPGGHSFMARRLGANFNEGGWVQEQVGGLTTLFALRRLIERIGSDWPSVATDLEDMRQRLLTRATLVANVTGDRLMLDRFEPELSRLLAALPAISPQGTGSVPWPFRVTARNEGFTFPAKVNYVAKGADIVSLGFELGGAGLVVDNFLGTTYLWDKIRLQGGAYGGFSSFDRLAGTFMFGSYRDPNLLGTIDAYDKAAEHLAKVPLTDAEVTRSIIGTIGGIDTYRLPDAKGLVSLQRHLAGDSEECRQKLREQVLGATVADFRKFADALAAVAAKGCVAILGSEEALTKADAERGGNWLAISKVL